MVISVSDSSTVSFYMDAGISFVKDDCSVEILRRLMNSQPKLRGAVVSQGGSQIGIVTVGLLKKMRNYSKETVVSEIMIPWIDVTHVDIETPIENVFAGLTKDFVVVLQNDRPVGFLWRKDVFWTVDDNEGLLSVDNGSLRDIVDRFPQALLVIDSRNYIIYHNRQIFNLLPEAPEFLNGFRFETVFGSLLASNYQDFLSKIPLRRVAESCSPLINVETKTVNGSTYLVDYYPIMGNQGVKYTAIHLHDITYRKDIESQSMIDFEELSKAFRLMLPTTHIEKRLKSIAEYRDIFDSRTGLIEITEVMMDGGYKHIINCLRIAAELQEAGVFRLPSLDRNTVVQTLILHDLGKKQPKLMVGDIKDPVECFEDGKTHAERSAKISAKYDFVTQDMIDLIRFHHHSEDELPDIYPTRLLPMLRLVRLIDGLSAGMTRKNAQVQISLRKSQVTVYETNYNTMYNGIRELDLISGRTGLLKAKV